MTRKPPYLNRVAVALPPFARDQLEALAAETGLPTSTIARLIIVSALKGSDDLATLLFAAADLSQQQLDHELAEAARGARQGAWAPVGQNPETAVQGDPSGPGGQSGEPAEAPSHVGRKARVRGGR